MTLTRMETDTAREVDAAALKQAGLTVVGGRLHARGRSFKLDARVEVDAEVRSPPWRLALGASLLSAAGLPVTLVVDTLTPRDLSWLVILPVTVLFGALASMLSMTERYCVVLRDPDSRRCVFSSDDHQLVLYLVTALRQAARGRS